MLLVPTNIKSHTFHDWLKKKNLRLRYIATFFTPSGSPETPQATLLFAIIWGEKNGEKGQLLHQLWSLISRAEAS